MVGGEQDEAEDEEDQKSRDGDDDDDEDDAASSSSSSSSDAPPPLQARDFSHLDEHIRAIIERYEGSVFPKMDWSAPRDAAWILPGQTLRCTTPADVYLLLKSSDFVAKDVEQATEAVATTSAGEGATAGAGQVAAQPQPRLNLILKRHFTSLSPAHEFRCFVRSGHFVAACQRDATTYYDFLQREDVKLDVRRKLRDFWVEHLRSSDGHGEDEGEGKGKGKLDPRLRDYVFDVYLTRDRSRVFLVDVNAYLPRTDALLWEWDELEAKATRAWRRSHGVVAHEDEDEEEEEERPAGAASFGDEDQESDDEGEDEEVRDPRGEPFIRMYTDGRAPTTHYEPWPADEAASAASTNGANGSRRRGQTAPLPTLRILTSQAQAQHAMGGAPAYVANMAPREAVSAADGGMGAQSEFLRAWREQQASA